MKVKSKREITVTLELNREETVLLMAMIQNPIRKDESEKERQLRYDLFIGMQNQLKSHG